MTEALFKPNVSENEALGLLRRKNLFQKRNIIQVERVWLPGYVFEGTIGVKSSTNTVNVFVDAIGGEFALLEERKENGECLEDDVMEKMVEKLKSGNEGKGIYSVNEALKIATEELKKTILKQSLLKKNRGELNSLVYNGPGAYPYWIGYFKRKEKIDFAVIDAVNGREQGARMKPVFIKFLLNEKLFND